METPAAVATDEARPSVTDVTKKFSVFEDGAYAYQVQEELNQEHYTGNISRRKTVRNDLTTAKEAAEKEALEAFRQEHEIAERNLKIEEVDREAARQMYKQMMLEEKAKLRADAQKDMEVAKEIQVKEKEKYLEEIERKKQTEAEGDREIARRLQKEEKEEYLRERQKQQELETLSATDREIARQLQQHEKEKYLMARKKKEERRRNNDMRDHRVSQEDRGRGGESSHRHSRSSMEDRGELPPLPMHPGKHNGMDGPLRVRLDNEDDDSEVHVNRKVALEQTDEMLARKMQRAEVQRARAPTEDEIRRQQEEHDRKIARKMQHEEVLIAKHEKKYKNYTKRVNNELASPEGEDHQRHHDHHHSSSKERHHHHEYHQVSPHYQGNIAAAVDPTYNPRPSDNVVLTSKGSLPKRPTELPPRDYPEDDGTYLTPIQGHRRPDKDQKNPKDKKKEEQKSRGSFFKSKKK